MPMKAMTAFNGKLLFSDGACSDRERGVGGTPLASVYTACFFLGVTHNHRRRAARKANKSIDLCGAHPIAAWCTYHVQYTQPIPVHIIVICFADFTVTVFLVTIRL